MYNLLLFYKYVKIDQPEIFCINHRKLCEELNLKGRIIIANEGINATVEGEKVNTDKYIDILKLDERFKDIKFKISESDGTNFPKLSCKVRDEIVSLNLGEDDFDPNEITGKYISAEELHDWIHSGKEFYIVDMRNEYEHKVGHFKNSVLPPLSNFRDLSKIIDTLEQLKDKTVVTVCTGGVRCEKASGYLVKKGFKDVYQLKDGIVTYMEKYPNEDFLGLLYVFDGRVTMGFNLDDPKRVIIGKCEKCQIPCEIYTNCANKSCHKHFICCDNCISSDGKKYCVDCSEEIDTIHAPKSNVTAKIIRDISLLDFDELKRNMPTSEQNQDFEYVKTKNYLRNKSNIFIVGYFAGEIAGILFGQKIEALDSRKEFFISELGVSSKHRRKGVATEMLNLLLSFLKSHKYTQCWVLTESNNTEANGLYSKLGGKSFADAPSGFQWNFE